MALLLRYSQKLLLCHLVLLQAPLVCSTPPHHCFPSFALLVLALAVLPHSSADHHLNPDTNFLSFRLQGSFRTLALSLPQSSDF